MRLKKPKNWVEQVKTLKIDAEKLPYGTRKSCLMARSAKHLRGKHASSRWHPKSTNGYHRRAFSHQSRIAFGVGKHLSCRE